MTAEILSPANVPTVAPDRSRHAFTGLRAVARRALRVRFRCLVMGHDDSFAREPRRLMLRCERCGRETAGWTIGGTAPIVTAARLVSPDRPTASDTTVRVGPWALQRRESRGEARDRQRRRLVAAATRLGA
jgi:hypothetical protein